jgi:DNA-binding beta-propeller fold protein YncE
MSSQKTTMVFLFTMVAGAVFFSACRKGDPVIPHEEQRLQAPDSTANRFFLLNEGNMGMNRSSLDYFDYTTGFYKKNIYGEINPTATKGLGDVGNDIQIYGSKVYAVINISDKVEVLDVRTAKRIGQINIKNCRYATFYKGKAYISSYAGNVGDPNSPAGFIAEVDTSTLAITRTVTVGRQPEEMAVVGNKLYITNSGGYSPPDYESTVSVIDMDSFKEVKRIEVAINLHRLKADAYGNLYVSSRGDYYNIPSNLYVIDTKTDQVKKSFNLGASNLWISGDSAYVLSVEWSYVTKTNTISYAIIDVKEQKILNRNFITDGTEKQIVIPYGIAVNPGNKDIYVTDAKDYISSGTLYCFDKKGKKKWSVRTGDIPAHFAFVNN